MGFKVTVIISQFNHNNKNLEQEIHLSFLK